MSEIQCNKRISVDAILNSQYSTQGAGIQNTTRNNCNFLNTLNCSSNVQFSQYPRQETPTWNYDGQMCNVLEKVSRGKWKSVSNQG